MTITITPLTALIALYLVVGVYFFGAMRAFGVYQVRSINNRGCDESGESYPLWWYKIAQPLMWLILWLPMLAVADYRIWKAQRERKGDQR